MADQKTRHREGVNCALNRGIDDTVGHYSFRTAISSQSWSRLAPTSTKPKLAKNSFVIGFSGLYLWLWIDILFTPGITRFGRWCQGRAVCKPRPEPRGGASAWPDFHTTQY